MCTYHLGHTFAYLPNGSTQVTWQHVTFLHIMIMIFFVYSAPKIHMDSLFSLA